MMRAGLVIAVAFTLLLTGCAKKAQVAASPAPEAASPAASGAMATESAAPAATSSAEESAAPAATSSGGAAGNVKLTGAITASYDFAPTCAIRGADAQKMGLAPGYILTMTPGGNINSGSVILTDYTKDDTYDETSHLTATPGATSWSPFDLNFALKPGGSVDILSSDNQSSLKVTISNNGTTGSATFSNFSAHEGRVSGTVTWTCAQVQR